VSPGADDFGHETMKWQIILPRSFGILTNSSISLLRQIRVRDYSSRCASTPLRRLCNQADRRRWNAQAVVRRPMHPPLTGLSPAPIHPHTRLLTRPACPICRKCTTCPLVLHGMAMGCKTSVTARNLSRWRESSHINHITTVAFICSRCVPLPAGLPCGLHCRYICLPSSAGATRS
jgi:hypothetical protein